MRVRDILGSESAAEVALASVDVITVDTDTDRQARGRRNAAIRTAIMEYRARAQSPPPPEMREGVEDEVEENEDLLARCPDCKGTRLQHAALQTRSADEGPSNYFRCLHCKKVVTPVYA